MNFVLGSEGDEKEIYFFRTKVERSINSYKSSPLSFGKRLQ